MAPGTILGDIWIVWLVSWLLAARWSGRTESRQTGLDQLKHSALIWIGTGLIVAHTAFPDALVRPLYARSLLLRWGGLVPVVAGLGWAWWARIHLGRQWSAAVTLKEDHALVRGGPYRITRHPIYSGLLFSLLVTVILQGTVVAFLGYLVLLSGLVLKIGQEERLLRAAFGADYVAYAADVPALFPGIW